MLAYATKLTRERSTIRREEIETLRRHGFNDEAIRDIACITAYFNFVNRVADGLGVEREDRYGEAQR